MNRDDVRREVVAWLVDCVVQAECDGYASSPDEDWSDSPPIVIEGSDNKFTVRHRGYQFELIGKATAIIKHKPPKCT